MIELPYPDKVLWPNGRTRSVQKRARLVRLHKDWALLATKAYLSRFNAPAVPARLVITVRPHATGPAPDQDNCVAAMKSYIDGIAAALNINDRTLAAPRIIIGERIKGGAVIVEVE